MARAPPEASVERARQGDQHQSPEHRQVPPGSSQGPGVPHQVLGQHAPGHDTPHGSGSDYVSLFLSFRKQSGLNSLQFMSQIIFYQINRMVCRAWQSL